MNPTSQLMLIDALDRRARLAEAEVERLKALEIDQTRYLSEQLHAAEARVVRLDPEAYMALAPVVAAAIGRTESPDALIRAARALRMAVADGKDLTDGR